MISFGSHAQSENLKVLKGNQKIRSLEVCFGDFEEDSRDDAASSSSEASST